MYLRNNNCKRKDKMIVWRIVNKLQKFQLKRKIFYKKSKKKKKIKNKIQLYHTLAIFFAFYLQKSKRKRNSKNDLI